MKSKVFELFELALHRLQSKMIEIGYVIGDIE